MSDWAIRVPASSANLGAGFDVLGMALTLYAHAGVGAPPEHARFVEPTHPARVAFESLGGSGELWVECPIPVSRGLGFSGAVRVAGAAAALVAADGEQVLDDAAARRQILSVTSELERHADNVAASIYGGVVVAAGGRVTRVPLAFNPTIVVWVPDAITTSTEQSRSRLPDAVPMADAVFNVGRAATFVAACASGDHAALGMATEDRLHQRSRLEQAPQSAIAIEAGLAAGAWAAWLSGSGPAVAMLCEPSRADEIAGALPGGGHVKLMRIDHEGVVAVSPEPG